jgi:Zn-dependent protease with chaperone function
VKLWISNNRPGEAPALLQQRHEDVPVPEPSARAIRYYRGGNALWAVDTALGLLIPALFLTTKLSAGIRTTAWRIGRRWLPAVMIYGFLFTLVYALLTLPLAYYEGFVREHAYGLSNQRAMKWLGDWIKTLVLSGVGLSLVLWIPYLLLKRSPRRWWLYAGLAVLPVSTFVLVVSPIWVDPLFNEFGRMEDRTLEGRILGLAERAGIPGSRVYQVRKSVDTKTVNAYVTGVGSTKRIVLWDTMLSELDADQIAFVMGHEMGHFVLHHVWTVIAGGTLLVTGSLYLVHRAAPVLLARYRNRFGFDRLPDLASFPLLLLLGGIVSLVLSPLILAFSRHQEHEADRFALELTRDNRAAATTFVRLQEENLSVPRPGPLYTFFRASHPSLGDRVDFANQYRPWETGRPLRYNGYFR